MFPNKVIASFWSRVQKTEGCWLWKPKPSHRMGYGKLYVGGGRASRQNEWTHRFSWILHFGPIPNGKYILHSCDTGSCVRPDHLFLGSAKENSQDMARKGRQWLQKAPQPIREASAAKMRAGKVA